MRGLRRAFILAVVVLAATGFRAGEASARVDEPTGDLPVAKTDVCVGPCMVYVTRYGAGTVRDADGWIDCGSRCEGGYGEGDRVVLTARPSAGYAFRGWTGCHETTSDGRCLLTTWSYDCIEAHFTGPGATVPNPLCGGTLPPPTPPPPPGAAPAEPTDHPPPGTRCTIVGSPRNDVLDGTFAADVICGGRGNDRIYGRGGHDLVLGGRGNDRLYGGPGREYLRGGAGDDLLVGGSEDDELFGEAGRDQLLARDGVADYVHGGSGRDRARLDARDVRRAIERRF